MAYYIPDEEEVQEPVDVTRLSAVLEQTKNDYGEQIGRITASWDVPDNGGTFNILLSTDDGVTYTLELLNVSGNSAVMDVEPDTDYYLKVVTVLGALQSDGVEIALTVASIPTPPTPVLTVLSSGIQIDIGIIPQGYTAQIQINSTLVIPVTERVYMYSCAAGSYSICSAYVDSNGNIGTYSSAATATVSELATKNYVDNKFVGKTDADYIKSASVSGEVLTLTQGNNSTVTFNGVADSSGVKTITADDGTDSSALVLEPTGDMSWGGVSLTDGSFITTQTETVVISQTASQVIGSVTAPTVSGYQFVCWIAAAPVSAVYQAYFESPTAATSNICVVDPATVVASNLDCIALYVRKW